ncbi:kinesin-like protein [Achlya hypogyna]|uniref:Kinesin-like protein n=1 Tax=Achlya hypogyna TaxID=1202772 RepID=A0A1V9ZFW4_ACHHY|nr:kinesin-like protein [Achlya hypogyna]
MATSSKRQREAIEQLTIPGARDDGDGSAPPSKSPNLGSGRLAGVSSLKQPKRSGLPVLKAVKARSNQDENDGEPNGQKRAGAGKRRGPGVPATRIGIRATSAIPAPAMVSTVVDEPESINGTNGSTTGEPLPAIATVFERAMPSLGLIDEVAKPRRGKAKQFDHKGRLEEQRAVLADLRGLLRRLEEEGKAFQLEAVKLDQAVVLHMSLANQDLARYKESEGVRSDAVTGLQAQVDELKRSLEAALKEKEAFQKQAQEASLKLQEELTAKVTLSTQKSEVASQLEQLRSEHDMRVTVLTTEKTQLASQRDAATAELALVRAQLARKDEDTSGTLQSMREMQAFAMSTNERLTTENKVLAEKLAALESSTKSLEVSSSEALSTIARLTAELEASEAAKADAVAVAKDKTETCAAATAELNESLRVAFAEKEMRQLVNVQLADVQNELKAVYAESHALRTEMQMQSTRHGDEVAKFEARRQELDEARAKAVQAAAAEMEALREANVSLESELHTWKTKWQETQAHQNMVEMAALCEAQREADVLKLRLKEAQMTGVQTMEAKDAAIAELTAKVKEGEALRRKLHNTIQELRGNVRVFARTRPFLPSDGPCTESAIVCDVDGVSMRLKKEKEEVAFTFDRVFSPVTGQDKVFDEVAEFVQSAIDGYQVCLFSYGQTGSGKTHTMQGSGNGHMRGIIPRSIEKIIDECAKNREAGWRYSLQASFLEIYNEVVRDLLAKKEDAGKPLAIKMLEKHGGVTVPDLTTVTINAVRDVEGLMDRASRLRSVASTDMNEQSSRSHSVFTLYLKGVHDEQGVVLEGRLNLVDLAGSERISRSGATGERLKEAQAINKSLSALTDVFNAIALKHSHVPFRNSKLTYLLQSCLSGDGKTLMMVNLSPTIESTGESLCSLRFAHSVNMCELGKAKRQFKKKTDADT